MSQNLRGTTKGKWGGDEGGGQHPGLPPARRVAQVLEGALLDEVVDVDLLGPARAGVRECGPGLGCRRRSPRPVGHPVRHAVLGPQLGVQVPRQLGAKAVQLVEPAEVLLAAQHRVVAGGPQQMGPGDLLRRQGGSVVPGADPVHEAAGHERHARGQAERGVAVGVVEGDPLGGEPVHRRGAHQRVSVGRAVHGGVLVGHDQQDVGQAGAQGFFSIRGVRGGRGSDNKFRRPASVQAAGPGGITPAQQSFCNRPSGSSPSAGQDPQTRRRRRLPAVGCGRGGWQTREYHPAKAFASVGSPVP